MSTMTKSERERVLDVMLEEMAGKDCHEVKVKEAMRRAGIVDEDIIGQLGDDRSWLFAAYGRLTERLIGKATEHCDSADEWPEKIRRGLESLLDALATNPEISQVMVRSFPAMRPEAFRQYIGLLEAFAPYLEEGRRFSGIAEELPSQVEMLALGAAEAIIFDEIHAGRTADLPSMAPAILFSVLVPFVGPDRASEAMHRAGGAA